MTACADQTQDKERKPGAERDEQRERGGVFEEAGADLGTYCTLLRMAFI
jgi:hypothetical protein